LIVYQQASDLLASIEQPLFFCDNNLFALRRTVTSKAQLLDETYDKLIRVSTGSAVTLELGKGLLDVMPTTVYLLTHHSRKCSANCLFCPQARGSSSRSDLLSRVSWPLFRLEEVVDGLVRAKDRVRRACIQATNYLGVVDDILAIVPQILSKASIDISVSCQPMDTDALRKLHKAGIDRIGIPLDAATPELFSIVKGSRAGGPYTWEAHMHALHQAVSVFGTDRVTTHVIVGLGETDQDMLRFIQAMVDLGIYPALFAFTPIPGTMLEKNPPPLLSRYRIIQTAHFLLANRLVGIEKMRFDPTGAVVGFGISREELIPVIRSGLPYLTSGCPNCNRPFYNEKPSGPIYNFPRPLTPTEIEEVERTLDCVCHG